MTSDHLTRLTRSMLFVPGGRPDMIAKAARCAADAVCLDLEDAVAPEAKAGARQMVCDAIRAGGYGKRELIVRVNALATPWGYADLAAVASCGADAILLPKVESGDMVRQALSILQAHGAPDHLTVWCMLETPRGILRAEEIAASPRLAALVMGTSDLAKDLHARHTRDRLPLLTSLGLCLLAARAYRLAILDGVHLDLGDDEGFAEACRQGRELGFDGKTLIHPKTIAAANAAFAPTDGEVAWARRIIAAHAEAEAAGRGVVLVDGKLIENLHVEDARRIVALADQIGEMERAAGA
jgi:citrate lyase subunit beta/citryl-CoA lyase